MYLTSCNNSTSSTCKVQSGVPQGSVLGPLLFLIFINDMPSCVSSPIKLFADDSKLYRGIQSMSDVEILQEDLNNLYNWTREWKMEFNKAKCHVVHHRKNNPKHLYHINGKLKQLRIVSN